MLTQKNSVDGKIEPHSTNQSKLSKRKNAQDSRKPRIASEGRSTNSQLGGKGVYGNNKPLKSSKDTSMLSK